MSSYPQENEDGSLEDLIADLQALVDAGLLTEVRCAGEPSRYELSAQGREFAAQRPPSAGETPIRDDRTRQAPALRLVAGAASGGGFEPPPPWPEPCPVCQSTAGYDGGARCRVCHVPWPPEM